eukprot:5783281-Pleurochrysis_carterae.AAC.1
MRGCAYLCMRGCACLCMRGCAFVCALVCLSWDDVAAVSTRERPFTRKRAQRLSGGERALVRLRSLGANGSVRRYLNSLVRNDIFTAVIVSAA